MSKIILNNGTELQTISNYGFEKDYQKQARRCIEFVFSKALYSIDYLYSLFCDTNCTSKITIIEGDIQHIHEGFVLNVSTTAYKQEISAPTIDDPAVYDNYVGIVMAQLSYLEKQQQELQVQIDDILVAMVEV